MMFDFLPNLVEDMQNAAFKLRKHLTKKDLQDLPLSTAALIRAAQAQSEETKMDEQARLELETALYCQEQYEAALVFLASMIPE